MHCRLSAPQSRSVLCFRGGPRETRVPRSKDRYVSWRPKGSILSRREDEDRKAATWERDNPSAKYAGDETRDADRTRERVLQADGTRRDRVVSMESVTFRVAEDQRKKQGVLYGEAERFLPLVGQEYVLNWQERDLAVRVEHVLSFLAEGQADLLRAYYIEHVPWQELRRMSESRQAVFSRIERAKTSFLRMFIEHAEDDIHLTVEDL